MQFDVPIRLTGGLNARDGHWSGRAKRVKAERKCVAAFAPLPYVWRQLAMEAERFTITLTRVSPRAMDDDGWVGRAKGIRDEVARLLGIDDGSPRLTWRYRQAKGAPHQHKVEVHVLPEYAREVAR